MQTRKPIDDVRIAFTLATFGYDYNKYLTDGENRRLFEVIRDLLAVPVKNEDAGDYDDRSLKPKIQKIRKEVDTP